MPLSIPYFTVIYRSHLKTSALRQACASHLQASHDTRKNRHRQPLYYCSSSMACPGWWSRHQQGRWARLLRACRQILWLPQHHRAMDDTQTWPLRCSASLCLLHHQRSRLRRLQSHLWRLRLSGSAATESCSATSRLQPIDWLCLCHPWRQPLKVASHAALHLLHLSDVARGSTSCTPSKVSTGTYRLVEHWPMDASFARHSYCSRRARLPNWSDRQSFDSSRRPCALLLTLLCR